MMDEQDLLHALHWWGEVVSCFHTGHSGCVSGALAVLSVFSLLMSFLMLLCHRCKLKACDAGSAVACGLYCLIGDLCNAAGSVLSHQFPLQIIMAVLMATLDVLLLTSVVLPFCWWHHSKTGRRARLMSRRRRQNSLAVCLLFGMGGYVSLGTLQVTHPSQSVTGSSPTSRRLLSVFLQDRIELLGYVLGLLSFAISWTSRFPFFLKVGRAEMGNPLFVSSRGLSALSGALYVSSILLYDTRLESVVRALPWILSGGCCAILDVAILFISCYRAYYRCQSFQPLGSDTVSLLGRRLSSGQHGTKDKSVRKHHLTSRKSSSPKVAEMGRYMDVHLQPVRKVCLKEVTITREGSADSQPLKRSVKVVRVDECYSSGSTTDSSSISSELEWDFEQATPQWSSQNGDQQNTQAFPLQQQTVDHKSKCNSRSSLNACFCHSADLEEQPISSPSDSVK
ncbi:transmembrane protein 44 [Salminus brasiliensis]|uniref:transmembrane protein 44 n=1 Tax=Salminus brasiliensis TaxID=930266 RepID=UPI003B83091E